MTRLVDRYFSAADLKSIEEAIRAAESRTSGELAVQIADHCHDWLAERLVCAGLLSLVVSAISLYFSREANWGYFYDFTQALLWSAAAFAAGFFGLGKLLMNRRRARRLVWRRALKLFSQLTPTRGHTGVLILVSLQENEAAIVADKGIADKLDAAYWTKPHAVLVKNLRASRHAEGLVETIGEIGARLAEHYPRAADDANELPNQPTIIDS